MKKIIVLFIVLGSFSCKQQPKDYVTLSGKITNKNSDSLVVGTREYSKTIKVNEDGTFTDTLKVDTGIYSIYDGTEGTAIYLKNGYDINMTLDTKQFDETVKYTGNGSENSNFLAEKSLLEEKSINMDALSNLDLKGLDTELENIKIILNEFYASKTNVDTSLVNSAQREVEPMLKFYKGYIGDAITLKAELPKGALSPTFSNYENHDGSKTSLTDLKGNYVYIDVWATWCGPCIAEIPSLKKVEKQYHDKKIKFVSISIDEEKDYDKWKNMVIEKELGGVQLLADNNWKSKFVTDYKINGIPRFILIDPNGNIVSADAPRPSNPKLIEIFEELKI